MSNTEPIWTTIHDAITGETITRELTPEEVAALPEPLKEESIEAQSQARLEAKASASAKLAALGLTEEEINAIIGGV
jgi:hypothetical protein